MSTTAVEASIELMKYLEFTRRCGHTTAVMTGAMATDAIVIVHNLNMSNYILKEWGVLWKSGGADTLTIGEVANGKLKGNNRPVVIDNAALHILLSDLLTEISVLRKENVDSRRKLEEIKSICR